MTHVRMRERGLSLLELVVFIVIVGIAFAALLGVLNNFNLSSADPLIRKQAVAIAESLLEEVQLMPFTFCDPDDANASTAASSGGCATAALSEDGAPHPKAGRTRYSAATPFANVSDYSGFSMSGVRAIYDASTVVAGLGNYTASVAISQAGTAFGFASDAEALRITVTVVPPHGATVVLEGFRTRYAPRTGL